LVAVGGVAGYYYNSTQSFQTKTASESKPKEVDYQQIYNEIAEMFDDDSE
jgi:cytochrome c peroxidase